MQLLMLYLCLLDRTKITDLKNLISKFFFQQYIFILLICLTGSLSSSWAQNSLNLEGSGQKWVNIGDVDVSGNQITIEAKMRRQNNMNIVSKHEGTDDCNYLLRPNSFQLSTTDDFYICLNTFTLNTNTWYHLAATYDGSSIKYYVDGCLVNEIPASGDIIVNNWDAAIGNKSNWPTGPEQFRGRIDEVRIWQSARTELEIKLNMNLLLDPTNEPDLRAYYKLDNNYDNDQGFSGFDGNPQGSPTFDAAAPLFIPFQLVSVTKTDVTCFGFDDGEIEISAIGNNLEYSLDGIAYSATPSFDELGPGNYDVYVKDGACEEIIPIEILEPSPVPTPDINTNDPICSTDTLFLSTTEVTNAFYFWEGPSGFTSTASSTFISNLNNSNSGDYSIYIEVDGCNSETTIASIIVNETYDISIIDTICSNEFYQFGPDELSTAGVYIQNLQSAAGCDSIVQLDLTVNPSYSFTIDTAICDGESISFEGLTMNTTGTYPFNLFTTLGCDSTITYELIVHPIPNAPIISTNSPLECPGDVIELSVNASSDAIYTWEGPNGFTSGEESLFFAAQINDMGTYSAMVTINGCESPLSYSDLEIINIYSFDDFEFPNVLTPNNDNSNDVFDLEGYFKTCNAYEMMYFDRWGNMVYSHKENETPFAGNSLDGSELMQGVYFYKLTYEDGMKQGFIHLIR